MFKSLSASIVGGIAVLLLVTGCGAPAEDSDTATKPSPSPTETALEADAKQLLADVGVVGNESGKATLTKANVPVAEGVSQEFATNAAAILREWYGRAALNPDSINAADLATAESMTYTDFDLLPDFEDKIRERAAPETAFMASTTYMGGTELIGSTFPTYAEFTSSLEDHDGYSTQSMILRASTLYTVELPDSTPGLMISTRELTIESPQGVDDVRLDWSHGWSHMVLGSDYCSYQVDHVFVPEASPEAQEIVRQNAALVISGAAQKADGWNGFAPGVEQTC